MVSCSNDTDILKYEPILFGELHLPWQVLIAGTGGTLNGTTFTTDDADFVTAQVSTGGVIYMRSADGSLDGAYEIVSVDSATQLSPPRRTYLTESARSGLRPTKSAFS